MDTKSAGNYLRQIFGYVVILSLILGFGFSPSAAMAQDENMLPTGYHDFGQGNQVSSGCTAGGWAIDPDHPGEDLLVRIWADSALVTEGVSASEYRSDLEESWNLGEGGCPGGHCAFIINLWEKVEINVPHIITIEVLDLDSAEWVALQATQKWLTCLSYEIFIYDTFTGDTRKLTGLNGSDAYNPSWSPDGKWIVHDVLNPITYYQEIYLTEVSSGISKPLPGGDGGNDAVWSPNGQMIAFDKWDGNLYIIPPEGGEPKLVREKAVCASWAPNSRRLAYFDWWNDGYIHTSALDGSDETIIEVPGWCPRWSSDGQWIAYQDWTDWQIYKIAVNIHGDALGDPILVIPTDTWVSPVKWSVNSKSLLFATGDSGAGDVWTMPAAGGEGARLTGVSGFGDYDPAYSNNGRYVAYAGVKPVLRWSVGLGAGTWPEQIEIEQQVVNEFNATQGRFTLDLEIDNNTDLVQHAATGDVPDVIGPVGWGGSNAFYGQWLDMAPWIEEFGFDLSQFTPALIQYFQTEEGQVGLPFAVFPAAMFYVPAMFDAAGLHYPPTQYGQSYIMPDGTAVEWSWDTVAAIAKLLTLDDAGKNATQDGFNREAILQVGYASQWQNPMHMFGFRGSGKLYEGEQGSYTAILPQEFKDAVAYYYEGMWGPQPFMPSGSMIYSDYLEWGNVFNSGHVAMVNSQTWLTGALNGFRDAGYEFQLGVLPSYNGQVYGRIDADTFRIWKDTPHPREAFEVVSYLVGKDPATILLSAYGGMPARQEQMAEFLAQKSLDFPFVTTWDPFIAGMNYPDIPSAEGYMPNWLEAWSLLDYFAAVLAFVPGIDLETAFSDLQIELQDIFNH